MVEKVIECCDEGKNFLEWSTLNLSTDEDYERELQVSDPADWFGEEDAKLFVQWDDDDLSKIAENMMKWKLTRHLPLTEPETIFKAKHLSCPLDIKEHIKRLRVRRQGDS